MRLVFYEKNYCSLIVHFPLVIRRFFWRSRAPIRDLMLSFWVDGSLMRSCLDCSMVDWSSRSDRRPSSCCDGSIKMGGDSDQAPWWYRLMISFLKSFLARSTLLGSNFLSVPKAFLYVSLYCGSFRAFPRSSILASSLEISRFESFCIASLGSIFSASFSDVEELFKWGIVLIPPLIGVGLVARVISLVVWFLRLRISWGLVVMRAYSSGEAITRMAT